MSRAASDIHEKSITTKTMRVRCGLKQTGSAGRREETDLEKKKKQRTAIINQCNTAVIHLHQEITQGTL